ncbi:MAG: bifunctional demethylmenaquinone methyltransferase/2-methoxy-6-polyprenyl-1,4-benzoquinol methylase UbiE [Cyanobacteria bacterium]|nr:bifunctional demethylmenaquinone methyltransferase/2-methoxy-6-polyprenyl-1,4-benzoquinol methylase UbiE [Cyanobacteriota bacterium]
MNAPPSDAQPSDALPSATAVRDLFDRIAPVYDTINAQLSGGLHRVWKRMAITWSQAQPGQTCLDLCCGSGDLALLLAERVGPTGQVYGLDFAVAQLAIAQQRAANHWPPLDIQWLEGDALDLPFAAATFDAATMGYGLRNLTDIPQGLRELHRVLKPGATAAILDFHQPQQPWMQGFQQWYLDQVVVPTATRHGLTAEYAYIAPSLERFPNGVKQVEIAHQVGFEQAIHYPVAGGLMGVLVVTR